VTPWSTISWNGFPDDDDPQENTTGKQTKLANRKNRIGFLIFFFSDLLPLFKDYIFILSFLQTLISVPFF
jgi:hypothetical protein